VVIQITLRVGDTSLSSQSLALILTTYQEQPTDRTQNNTT